MTPLYDVLIIQPTVDARQIERKDFRLAMRMGKSKRYKVGAIIGRHITETGRNSACTAEGLSPQPQFAAARVDPSELRMLGSRPARYSHSICWNTACALRPARASN